MTRIDNISGSHLSESKSATELARLGFKLPDDVKSFISSLFVDCNLKTSTQLSIFPNTHEETLDQILISHLAQMQGPVRLGSSWVLRLDAHFIGGGRHYRTWEVADIGLMVIFRRKGKIIRSKLVFLQSKRLYASTQKYKNHDPYYRQGMGRLLVTDDEHLELIERKTIRFSEKCRYKALVNESTQHNAMKSFAKRHRIKLYYLFYNPVELPWSINSPVEQLPQITKNIVGCRVLPMDLIDQNATDNQLNGPPSYKDIKDNTKGRLVGDDVDAGWRLEYFVNDLFVSCRAGMIDDTPNFERLHSLLTQKTSPISSAISITFDLDE